MATAITTTDLVNEFGAYYQKNGQGVKDIYRKLRYGTVTEQLFKKINTVDTKKDIVEAVHDRVVQPYQSAFTPISSLEFKPHTIPLYKVKIDLELLPDELIETWVAFLEGEGIDRKSWPFVKWYIANEVLPQSLEDWEMNEVFAGVKAAIIPGTAGAAGTSTNGIKKIINDHITAGDITTIATGALSSDPETFVGQIESFMEAISKLYWKKKMKLAMNEDRHQLFLRGMDLKYNVNFLKQADMERVRFFKASVFACPSMVGSDKIWCTPQGNAVCYVKYGQNGNRVDVKNSGANPRALQIYTDWYKGLGFLVPGLVFTNDQDLV